MIKKAIKILASISNSIQILETIKLDLSNNDKLNKVFNSTVAQLNNLTKRIDITEEGLRQYK